jgi:hypothetical protein
MPKVVDRTNEERLNSFGSHMIIESYTNSNDIQVRFTDTGNLVKARYWNFKRGLIKNVYDKAIYGVGFFGEGEYKSHLNGKRTKVYNTWIQMIHRSYSEKLQIKQPAYKGCSVVEEWHNFQNFAKWYEENYYEIEGQRMELDKDILVKGNKLYSPDTCVFVPKAINNLLIKPSMKRETLPVGVSKSKEKYQANCYNSSSGKLEYLGVYDTKEEAFNAYKSYKEQYVKKVAEDYKSHIPVTLFEALMNYVVEITD